MNALANRINSSFFCMFLAFKYTLKANYAICQHLVAINVVMLQTQ